ncbi:unnamed protein product [Moneuplotes crassus]|uniref:Uncharacterized protein n=1 Tax=Euplotes crassus TaxID=5936 RepID=A0AAD2CV91_EUPCR|nr:unnamed protein product [Moneuplotes crassus]
MVSGVIIIKVVFIILIAAMAFVAGILPGIIPWCKRSTNVLGIANAFSGGVFLAIAFLHILPEATSGYREFMEQHEHSERYAPCLRHGNEEEPFPLPFALAFVGYAFILLIDKVIFDTHSLVDGHGHGSSPKIIPNVRKEHNDYEEISKEINEYGQDYDENEGPQRIQTKFVACMDHTLNRSEASQESNSFNKTDRDSKHGEDTSIATHHDHLINSEERKKKRCSCNLTPVVLCIALSVHSVFEGIATGLIKETSDLWTFVIAIGAHKWAAAMSLGISMTKNFKNQTGTVYIVLTIFSLATPLGVLIGMIVATQSAIVDIIFSSLAAGTFVYIACSEVIVEEFSVPKYRWIKMFSFLIGASLIIVLGLLE